MKNAECRNHLFHPAVPSLILATLFALGGCTRPDRAKAQHVSSGEALLKAEKYQEALLEFRNALQIDDKLAAAQGGSARSFEGLQRFKEAFDELKRTADLDLNNLEARLKLGNYFIACARRSAEAVVEAQRLGALDGITSGYLLDWLCKRSNSVGVLKSTEA